MTLDMLLNQGFAALQQDDYNISYNFFYKAYELDNANPTVFLGMGMNLVGLGDVEKGVSYLVHATELAPHYEQAYFFLGRILIHDYPERAVGYFRQSFQLRPKNNQSAYFLVEIGYYSKDEKLLREYLDEAIKLVDLEGYMCVNLAKYLGEFAREESDEWHIRNSENFPNIYQAQFNRAIMHYERGEYDLAYNYAKNSLKVTEEFAEPFNMIICSLRRLHRYNAALQYCERGLILFPESFDLLKLQAYLNYRVDKYDMAEKLLNALFNQRGADSDMYFYYGKLLEDTGRYEKAIDCFQSGLKLEPDNLEMKFCIGTVYSKMGEVENAEVIFEEIKVKHPRKTGVYYELFFHYYRQGKLALAIKQLEISLEIKPNQPLILTRLLLMYERTGSGKDVNGLYKKGIEDFPYEESLRANYLNHLRGIGLSLIEVLVEGEKAIASIPESELLHSEIGYIYLELKNFDNAEYWFKQGLTHSPMGENCLVGLGIVHDGRLEPEKAVQLYHKALSHHPQSYTALCAYALNRLSYEKEEDAYEMVIRAIKIIPDSSEGYRILSYINLDVNPEKDKHFLSYSYLLGQENASFKKFRLEYSIAREWNLHVFNLCKGSASDLDNMIQFHAAIDRAIEKVKPFTRLFSFWRNGHKINEGLKAEAVSAFYIGDPIHALNIFAHRIGEDYYQRDTMSCYYYALMVQNIGLDVSEQVQYVVSLAKKAKLISPKDSYYYALTIFLSGEIEQAIEILESIKQDFRPAYYQLVILYKVLANKGKQDVGAISTEIKDKLTQKVTALVFELSALEETEPMFAYGIEKIKPDLDPDNFLNDIQPLLYFLEAEEILGMIFKKQKSLDHAFENVLVLDSFELKANQYNSKEELSHIWEKMVGTDVNEKIKNNLINMLMVNSDVEFELARMINRGCTSELALVRNNYQVNEPFEFKLHLQVIFKLYQNEKLKIQQAFNLMNYLQYCLQSIPYKKMSETVNLLIDTCVELLMDAMNVPNLYWLEKLEKLRTILKEEKTKKAPPLMAYKQFIAINDSGEGTERSKSIFGL
ncbi:tetratricopeptide repeat protein [Pedobacter endophyticus]|uniref:Tetratricopeptide repeat protein n=1 Tax=Pedobacter endophyticus TaxID=2789740 RepID=A0A7U3Q523_9SPHI|nr:tetratricopeptide repeat protein [Pedobacter endophyticus]QPH38746.1 tetratricopeptide repeat protein [Pedobacter endophyticus]